ncbi:polymorphic toxin-type HINT domain-containing protein [Paenibacillus ehimensis]|uniref:polymorphic toxin-type HINT domain-containing protein n=1 Tax=Paenibacillus ehimensis TaxID=79264 RepID=UPI001FEC59E1|nr:polymorphic toxin-type HINT domain-containing protein [Paenibacillus ehimensis]
MTDAKGQVTDRYTYGPYGETLKHEGSTDNPFQYNGRDGVMTDPNGLYYMRARYYQPEIKRFVNRDVLTGTISEASTLNRYAYVNGNPVSYVAPFGLSRDGHSSFLLQGGNFLVDTMPWVGTIKGFQQAFLGTNFVTGERLSTGDRWAEGIGSALSLIPIPGLKHAGKYATKGVIAAEKQLERLFMGPWMKKAENTAKKLINECNCFTAGTKVLTDEGEKNIEDIEVGDKVLAKSDETGEVAYKEVVGLFQKQADEIYYVRIGDEIIEVTGEHPFWLDGKGWTLVKDLKVGDLLVSSNGTKLAIDRIEKEPRQATVYNFEVRDFNSYFVSNLGIWVHNCALINLPSARWINHDIYNELKRLQLDKKFVKAKDMGYAKAREGADGIISLTSNEIIKHKGYTYTHKIKVVGAPNHVRIYGRIDENGAMVFDHMTDGKR